MNRTLRTTLSIVITLALLGVAGWAYWYFLMGPSAAPATPSKQTINNPSFKPIGKTPTVKPGQVATTTTIGGQITSPAPQTSNIATLRLLSSTPVGGYGIAGQGASTSVRWIDRGRGNIYEATYTNSNVTTLSNTIVPRMVMSVWNKNLTAFVGSLFQDGDETLSTVYAQLLAQSTSSQSSSQVTPYELRGKNISGDLIGYAASPDKSKIFMYMNESGKGAGYISSFDGKNMTRIFSTPLTQVNVDWPTDTIITVTNKGSATYNGFLYFVNPKTGVWKKILGSIKGLSAKVSHDGKYVLYSGIVNGALTTSVFNVATGVSTDAIIKTMADKCAWGNTTKNMVYCGVPSPLPDATYPDDWYIGTQSLIDKIWQLNAATGEVHLISSITDQSDRSIDSINMTLDPKDKYLFLMSKADLSLWSLDLSKNK